MAADEPAEEEAQPASKAPVQLDNVEVTAQRRSESIQKVPVAVTAITGQDIEKSNITGIEGYLSQTPNVSFASNGSRDRKEISVRGISNQLDPYSDVRPSAYGFYIDDFSVASATSNPEVVDLERIEVLRGPQGTYFGRNAIGGAINITTHKPEDSWYGQVDLSYASHNTRSATAILNIPVAPGLFDLRLSARQEKSDGYIENVNPIGGGNDSDYSTARIIARLTPSDRLTWDNTLSYTSEEVGMRSGVPTGYLTSTWRSVYYGGATGFIADDDGVGFYPDNTDRVNFNRPQSVGTRWWYATSHLTYDFDAATLTAIAGYLDNDSWNRGDVDGGSYDYFYETDNMTRRSTSGELRLQSSGERLIDWSVGAMGGKDSGSTFQETYYGTDNTFGKNDGDVITGVYGDASTRYAAVFGQGTWNFSERAKLILGGRYSYEKVQYHQIRASNGAVSSDSDRSKAFNDFSPRVTLSWQASENTMYYATISRGFKSGGVQTAQASLKDSYDPETLWSYEIGGKWDLFDHRLRLDASAFYMDWKNVQQSTRFYISTSGSLVSVTGIDNAASARSFGFDGSATMRITSDLTASLQVGYLNAKYLNYQNALIDGAVIGASGMPMINAPRWTASTQLEYRRPVSGNYEGFVRGEWSFRDQALTSSYGLRYDQYPFVAPSYTNTNLRLGIESGKLTVTAYVENLFDKHYFTNVYEKAFYSGVQAEPAYRSVGLKLSYRFY
ncbi:TonB-dependent receptor [Stenotrophomonas sp. MMGLT7]|uniref:TonB-dependent receptor n=1 Tax=Stenotrophomonas sp. MMGLT7 TaxID=2901227 RepID=UPI001E3195D7|nr:TonB-dependent receptor [Stenotrophomonas sp. MMGLT7]MCD7098788.1 TonB-dependent receptor [Stenotrophomonas sp. MMGLT7]